MSAPAATSSWDSPTGRTRPASSAGQGGEELAEEEGVAAGPFAEERRQGECLRAFRPHGVGDQLGDHRRRERADLDVAYDPRVELREGDPEWVRPGDLAGPEGPDHE